MGARQAAAAKGLEVTAEGPIVRLTLNRPEKRNALAEDLIVALGDELKRLEANEQARVVVLASEGPVFSSGHDLNEMVGRAAKDYEELFARCSLMMSRFRRLPQAVIARVQGPAVAAGCQLVAACDLAVAADNATFATPGVKIGLFCATPMVPLVRAIPQKPALEMLLTGEPISAQRALALGLVNRVVPAGQLDAAVHELAGAILATTPAAVRLGKAAFYNQLALDERSAYDIANDTMTQNAVLPETQEGMSAFLQKRPPNW